MLAMLTPTGTLPSPRIAWNGGSLREPNDVSPIFSTVEYI
jgi:hypothetical protein